MDTIELLRIGISVITGLLVSRRYQRLNKKVDQILSSNRTGFSSFPHLASPYSGLSSSVGLPTRKNHSVVFKIFATALINGFIIVAALLVISWGIYFWEAKNAGFLLVPFGLILLCIPPSIFRRCIKRWGVRAKKPFKYGLVTSGLTVFIVLLSGIGWSFLPPV